MKAKTRKLYQPSSGACLGQAYSERGRREYGTVLSYRVDSIPAYGGNFQKNLIWSRLVFSSYSIVVENQQTDRYETERWGFFDGEPRNTYRVFCEKPSTTPLRIILGSVGLPMTFLSFHGVKGRLKISPSFMSILYHRLKGNQVKNEKTF